MICQATSPADIPPSGDQRRLMPKHEWWLGLAQNLNPDFNVV
jgi:hypothetical protein